MPDVEAVDACDEDPPLTHEDPGASKRSVSFNRDVHVKRIAPNRAAAGAPQADGVRRQPLARLSRQELADEAAKVLAQASSVKCSSSSTPEKFFSLPNRRRQKSEPYSVDPGAIRRKSEELGVTTDLPSKGPRTSLNRSSSDVAAKKYKSSSALVNIFKRPDKDQNHPPQESAAVPKKKSTVKRSKSDVSDLQSSDQRQIRKRTGSESEEYLSSIAGKKTQLSPIIEVSQSDDYFKPKNTKLVGLSGTREFDRVVLEVPPESVGYKVNPIEKPPRTKEPRPPVRPKRSRTLREKPQSVGAAVKHFDSLPRNKTQKRLLVDEIDTTKSSKNLIRQTVKSFESANKVEKPPEMIHSSQKPVDKLPLTKGQTVDNIVKILNQDKYTPPPKASLILPPSTAAHNNNQPFSYTKPTSVSPDPNLYARSPSPERPPSPVNKMNPDPGRGIIYAQVVCGENEKRQRNGHHSDEDEGLGYEDRQYRRKDYAQRNFDEQIDITDSPITPRFKEYRNRSFIDDSLEYENGHILNTSHRDYPTFDEPIQRGRGDGMDSRRRDSLNEPIDSNYDSKIAELSYRRELLESRFNARRKRDHVSPGKVTPRFSSEKELDDVNMTKHYVEDSLLHHNGSDLENAARQDYKYKSKLSRDSPSLEMGEGVNMDRREFIDKRLAEEPSETKYFTRPSRYFPPEPEYEPPSLELSSSSKYSPENRKYKKSSRGYMSSQDGLNTRYNTKQKQEKFASSREHYASNPEISQKGNETFSRNKGYDPLRPETFHNSLQRYKEKDFQKESTRYENENKFADSGIENDYRKESKALIRGSPPLPKNESEDEGFASSLLITGERQHHEDVKRIEGSKHERSTLRRDEFVHRERSIDDGSFYDPRIDRFEERTTKRQLSSKPPKVAKKISGLEKVKQLFSRDSSKKSKKDSKKSEVDNMVREEDLRRRYTEYRGSSEHLDSIEPRKGRVSRGSELELDSRIGYNERISRTRDEADSSLMDYDYSQRRRLATPTPSPSPPRKSSEKVQSSSWFKSLDRLSKNKTKASKVEKESTATTEEESVTTKSKKNLRFFGDTDQESNDSISKHHSILRKRSNLSNLQTGTLNRNGKMFSNSVGSLDRRNAAESRHKSSSYGNLNTTLDSRQQLLANSYNKEKYGGGNSRDLHNISEIHSNSETESQFEERERRFNSDTDHRYGGASLSRDRKPPMSPLRDRKRSRSQGGTRVTKSSTKGGYGGDFVVDHRSNLSELKSSKNDVRNSRQEINGSRNDLRNRRRRTHTGASPADSSTEGDSSHQSQRSIVYLHAATVGDIPTTGRLSRGRSRDDVSSMNSSLRPQVKTVSRSFSVLAPWKPRHYREGYDINYSQQNGHDSTLKKKSASSKRDSGFIFGSKSASTRNLSSSKYDTRSSEERTLQNKTNSSTLTRKVASEDDTKGSGTLLRKGRGGSSKENLNGHQLPSKGRADQHRNYKKSMSTEVLARDSPPRTNRRTTSERERLSRSISMPKDSNKSAGWFKMTKKNKNIDSGSRVY